MFVKYFVHVQQTNNNNKNKNATYLNILNTNLIYITHFWYYYLIIAIVISNY